MQLSFSSSLSSSNHRVNECNNFSLPLIIEIFFQLIFIFVSISTLSNEETIKTSEMEMEISIWNAIKIEFRIDSCFMGWIDNSSNLCLRITKSRYRPNHTNSTRSNSIPDLATIWCRLMNGSEILTKAFFIICGLTLVIILV